MTASLIVLDPGLFSTLQDLGRWGYLRFGVSNSGAMDTVSLRVANMLVGNDPGEAAIEFTAAGGTYEVATSACRIAIAGGNFPLTIDGQVASPYSSHTLRRGNRVAIGCSTSGMRGYLAVAGGFEVAPMLGSLSTYVRFGIGGLDGKSLRRGSRIPLRDDDVEPGGDLCMDPSLMPSAGGSLRVVLGPQDDYFTLKGIETFLASPYTVTDQCDRMGYRLEGPKIEHAGDFNIVSDGIAAGSVQVPGNRLPIVLMADRMTTGGYPKIATVITADLHRLAQKGPGDVVRFETVSVEEAENEYLRLLSRLDEIAASLEPADSDAPNTSLLLTANLIGGVC